MRHDIVGNGAVCTLQPDRGIAQGRAHDVVRLRAQDARTLQRFVSQASSPEARVENRRSPEVDVGRHRHTVGSRMLLVDDVARLTGPPCEGEVRLGWIEKDQRGYVVDWGLSSLILEGDRHDLAERGQQPFKALAEPGKSKDSDRVHRVTAVSWILL
jgi:hypothetical protein